MDEYQNRALIHAVDMQTSAKFTTSKKFKTWLASHPNFKRRKEDGKYVHIYEAEAVALKEKINEQRSREDLQLEPSEVPEEGSTEQEPDV